MWFKVFFHHSLSIGKTSVQSGSLCLSLWVTSSYRLWGGGTVGVLPAVKLGLYTCSLPQTHTNTHTHSAFIVFFTAAFYFLPTFCGIRLLESQVSWSLTSCQTKSLKAIVPGFCFFFCFEDKVLLRVIDPFLHWALSTSVGPTDLIRNY